MLFIILIPFRSIKRLGEIVEAKAPPPGLGEYVVGPDSGMHSRMLRRARPARC